ncbi:hypothetical protein LCGC14_0849680 [marine sediment metagenome]|uniref:Calcineurin-like phosphoesterase domain-containing protein n=1 Tax=marine sediment metagenome TaxID=412755 RepID=A0A0F9PAP5_9ZZZZ
MKILHISDFHFGNNSIQQDTIYPTIPDDFLYKTQKFMKTQLELPDLVIFTGDLISKGKIADLKSPIILDFLKYFTHNNIPILICNGNHDLDENNIENKNQFVDFNNFILEHQKELGINISENFYENQASYMDFPRYNTLFISLNSCHNIITNKEQDFKKPATISYQLTDEFFNELRQKIKYFFYRNKFVIIHHPLEKLKEHIDSIKILKKNNVKVVFAGDSHKFSKTNYDGIYGITAGTLFGSNSIKWDQLNLIMQPNQFNYYNLDSENDSIKISQFIVDNEFSNWILKKQLILDLDILQGWNLKDWYKYLGINKLLEKLEAKSVEFIFQDGSKEADYIGITSELNSIKIFYLDREEQQKVEVIKYIYREQQLKKKNHDFIVFDKTKKLKGQISTLLIEEV